MTFDLRVSVLAIAVIALLGPLAMLAMDRAVSVAVAHRWVDRPAGAVTHRLGWADFRYMAGFVIVTGVLALGAQLALFWGRTIPLDFGVRPLEMLAFSTVLMLLVDTNGFFWHRFSHRHARAYRAFHAGHHATRGEVHVATAFHASSLWDYPIHSGVVLSLALSALVPLTGHYPVVTIVYAITVYVLGIALTHSGLCETPRLRVLLWVVLLPIEIVPTAIRLEDHLRHHARGNCNYGVFFSHWDRLFGSWEPSVGPSPSEAAIAPRGTGA